MLSVLLNVTAVTNQVAGLMVIELFLSMMMAVSIAATLKATVMS